MSLPGVLHTRKFSQFPQGTLDEAVGLGSGINTRGLASGGGGGTTHTVTQANSFQPGQWVRADMTTSLYQLAQGDSAEDGEAIGLIITADPTQFTVQQDGYVDAALDVFSALYGNLTFGEVQFLSTTTLGQMSANDATINGQVSRPVFIPTGVNEGWIVPYRPLLVGGLGTGGGGGGGTDTNIHTVSQPGNGFGLGDWVRVSGENTYTKAIATSLDESQSVGTVIQNGDPVFTIQFAGYNAGAVTSAIDATGAPVAITPSTTYYLSEITAGKMCPTEPLLPFAYSKPVFTSESVAANSGWILPQRPLSNPDTDPGASPWIYLGRLDPSNNYGNSVFGQTCLMSSEGKLFRTYKIIKVGGANVATVPAGVTNFGFQFYGGGAWKTTAYAHYYSGVNSTANATTTGVLYGRVHNLGTLTMAEVTAAVSRINTFGGFEATFTRGVSGFFTFTSNFTDNSINPLPGGFGYTAQGISFGGGGPGDITGLRLVASNGAVMTTIASPYFLIYGIPNTLLP